jgi:hypothetical protein
VLVVAADGWAEGWRYDGSDDDEVRYDVAAALAFQVGRGGVIWVR